jgi:SARP family transcriptional regulator, regulator of embCAB operon
VKAEKVLRQEPLLREQSARATAFRANQTASGTADRPGGAVALRDGAGRGYPLRKTVMRIGRLADSLRRARPRRSESPVTSSLTWGQPTACTSKGARIRPSAALSDGDQIAICDYQFTFEVQSS